MGAVIQDQYYPGNDGSFSLIASTYQRAQTFPVTKAGVLDHVNVYVNDSNATGESLLWDIRSVSAGTPLSSDASVLASGTVPSASIPVYPNIPPTTLELAPLDIQVEPGEMLAVTLRTSGSNGFGWRGTFFTNPGEKFIRYGNNSTWQADTFFPGRPLGFATYVETVPEPTTVALLLAGGLCLLGCRWRRRRPSREASQS